MLPRTPISHQTELERVHWQYRRRRSEHSSTGRYGMRTPQRDGQGAIRPPRASGALADTRTTRRSSPQAAPAPTPSTSTPVTASYQLEHEAAVVSAPRHREIKARCLHSYTYREATSWEEWSMEASGPGRDAYIGACAAAAWYNLLNELGGPSIPRSILSEC
ncbi:hypothetical protein FKP32DRAFT_1640529 [Trametes sanguinea]|nr:hypothetical protein FKP32DRAFT_1640529 [Trametes sanguinea]